MPVTAMCTINFDTHRKYGVVPFTELKKRAEVAVSPFSYGQAVQSFKQ